MWLLWRIIYMFKRNIDTDKYGCPWCGSSKTTYNFNYDKSVWTCNRCKYKWR